MDKLWPSFGIGFVAGLRSMTACAALTWAAALERTRTGWIPVGPGPRSLATAAALAEMAGDKMPFAPDRRIAASVLARFTIGAVGGAVLAGRDAPLAAGALAGIAGAALGTLLGRAARGGATRSAADWARALTEDAVAAGLAAALVGSAERRRQVRRGHRARWSPEYRHRWPTGPGL
jgi:uncharacterized membrane protein